MLPHSTPLYGADVSGGYAKPSGNLSSGSRARQNGHHGILVKFGMWMLTAKFLSSVTFRVRNVFGRRSIAKIGEVIVRFVSVVM